MRVPGRISDFCEALAIGAVATTVRVSLHRAVIDGRPVLFCTNKRRDPIQRANRKGRFYEQAELNMLSQLVPAGATIVDIGANIGNHSLYFALFMQAKRVIPFEPNPLTYEVLIANVLANGLSDVIDLSYLGVGLSDAASNGYGMEDLQRNLGAASMIEGAGDISLARADEALGDIRPDLIKLDVEGMEMGVLRGLGDIPAKSGCLIYAEVNNENAQAFAGWCDEVQLTSVHNFRRYRNSIYHVLAPAKSAAKVKKKIDVILKERADA